MYTTVLNSQNMCGASEERSQVGGERGQVGGVRGCVTRYETPTNTRQHDNCADINNMPICNASLVYDFVAIKSLPIMPLVAGIVLRLISKEDA